MTIILGDSVDTRYAIRANNTGKIILAVAFISLAAALAVGIAFACRKPASQTGRWGRATGLRSSANQGVTAGATFAVVALTVPFGPDSAAIVPQAPKLSLRSSGVYSVEVSANVSNSGATATDVTLNLEVVKTSATVNYPLVVSVPAAETKIVTFHQLVDVAEGTQPATLTLQISSSVEPVSVLSADTFMSAARVGRVV